jgi:glycosyltransferase involved in cell wall biosynthesis
MAMLHRRVAETESDPRSGRLNVVVVNAELPYPPNAGNRIRTLNLLERLAPRHRITFIARRGDPEETEPAIEYLEDRGIRTIVVDDPVPRKSGWTFYARLAANVLSPYPYSVSSHGGDRLRRTVRSVAAEDRVQIWQAEWTPYIGALRGLRSARRVVMAHNVESLIWQRYYEAESDSLKRWYIKQQWRKFEWFERRAFAAATRVVAVSSEDARLIRERFGGQEVDVVDNGIDRAYFEGIPVDRDPRQILFLGSLDWRPNLDAIDLLLDRIFPQVHAAEPSARLCLVGRRPPAALVRQVSTFDTVELHADVPDVRPFLARSGVMVVPLRIGGGSRLKILEALGTGLPVVSTRVGAEGLELVAGDHYIAADDPEAMARALVACLRDPAPAWAMAEQGRRLVLDRYDWDHLADRLERVWFDCLRG